MSRGSSPTFKVRVTVAVQLPRFTETTLTLSDRWFTTQRSSPTNTAETGRNPTLTEPQRESPFLPLLNSSSRSSGVLVTATRPLLLTAIGRTPGTSKRGDERGGGVFTLLTAARVAPLVPSLSPEGDAEEQPTSSPAQPAASAALRAKRPRRETFVTRLSRSFIACPFAVGALSVPLTRDGASKARWRLPLVVPGSI
jgi:hypothetical protein